MYKKVFSAALLFAFIGLYAPVFAYSESMDDVEHMTQNKNTKIDLVKITQSGNIIQKENYLEVVLLKISIQNIIKKVILFNFYSTAT